MATAQQQSAPPGGFFQRFASGTWRSKLLLKKPGSLGDDSKLYHNKELNRWVEKGKEDQAAAEAPPPAPPIKPLASFPAPSSRRSIAQRYVLQPNLSVSTAGSNSILQNVAHSGLLPPAPLSQQSADLSARIRPPVLPSAPTSQNRGLPAHAVPIIPPPPRSTKAPLPVELIQAAARLGQQQQLLQQPDAAQGEVTETWGPFMSSSPAGFAASPPRAQAPLPLLRAVGSDLAGLFEQAGATTGDLDCTHLTDQAVNGVRPASAAKPGSAAVAQSTASTLVAAAMMEQLKVQASSHPKDRFGREFDFDSIMHPRAPGKLDGPLPWELPDDQRHADTFIKACTGWHTRNPGAVYEPRTPASVKVAAAANGAAAAVQPQQPPNKHVAPQTAASSVRSIPRPMDANSTPCSILDMYTHDIEEADASTGDLTPAADVAVAVAGVAATEAAVLSTCVSPPVPLGACISMADIAPHRVDAVVPLASEASLERHSPYVGLPPSAENSFDFVQILQPAMEASNLLQDDDGEEYVQLPPAALAMPVYEPHLPRLRQEHPQLQHVATEQEQLGLLATTHMALDMQPAGPAGAQGEADAAAWSTECECQQRACTDEPCEMQRLSQVHPASAAGLSASGDEVPVGAVVSDVAARARQLCEARDRLLGDDGASLLTAEGISELLTLRSGVEHALSSAAVVREAMASSSSSTVGAATTSTTDAASCSDAGCHTLPGEQQLQGHGQGGSDLQLQVHGDLHNMEMLGPVQAAQALLAEQALGNQEARLAAAAEGLPLAHIPHDLIMQADLAEPQGTTSTPCLDLLASTHQQHVSHVPAAVASGQRKVKVKAEEEQWLLPPPPQVTELQASHSPSSLSTCSAGKPAGLTRKTVNALQAAAAEKVAAATAAAAAPRRDTWQMYERRIAQHKKQLDATKLQLDNALQKLSDMQVEFDELLLCLGMESAKNNALCEALRDAGIDPEPLMQAVEAQWMQQ